MLLYLEERYCTQFALNNQHAIHHISGGGVRGGVFDFKFVFLSELTLFLQIGFCGCTVYSGGTTEFCWCICRILLILLHLAHKKVRKGAAPSINTATHGRAAIRKR